MKKEGYWVSVRGIFMEEKRAFAISMMMKVKYVELVNGKREQKSEIVDIVRYMMKIGKHGILDIIRMEFSMAMELNMTIMGTVFLKDSTTKERKCQFIEWLEIMRIGMNMTMMKESWFVLAKEIFMEERKENAILLMIMKKSVKLVYGKMGKKSPF